MKPKTFFIVIRVIFLLSFNVRDATTTKHRFDEINGKRWRKTWRSTNHGWISSRSFFLRNSTMTNIYHEFVFIYKQTNHREN